MQKSNLEKNLCPKALPHNFPSLPKHPGENIGITECPGDQQIQLF